MRSEQRERSLGSRTKQKPCRTGTRFIPSVPAAQSRKDFRYVLPGAMTPFVYFVLAGTGNSL